MKRWLLLLVFSVPCAETVHAQWTSEDSVWLQDVLSGKKELRLSPEAKNILGSGNLLRSLISKDFSEYLEPDEGGVGRIAVPPAVLIRQGLDEKLPIDKINRAAFGTPAEAKEPPIRLSGAGASVSVDIEGALRQLFIPSERAKARNRRNANAWKYY
ncbi:MAG: hypothetical protein LBS05_05960 [Tannerellaceae bacterium]|nr:hypothetical protein [Tannerellaceae bacterium]